MNKLAKEPEERIKARALLWRSCLTCDKFKEAEEMCTVYNARPPARIIAYGCAEYTEDIPF